MIQSQPAPTVLSAAKSAFGLLGPIQNWLGCQPSRLILREFSAAILPGEMLLVIGKPGSGCTTFLKTLAGMWDEYKDVQGEQTLGGRPMMDIVSKRPQDVVFCGKPSRTDPAVAQ